MSPSRRRRIVGAPWVALTAAILERSASLPDAACRGSTVHDGDDGRHGEQTRQAIAICQRCPELLRCADWVDGLPERRATGVVAGRWRSASKMFDDPAGDQ